MDAEGFTKIQNPRKQKNTILRESVLIAHVEEAGQSGGHSRDLGSSLAWPSLLNQESALRACSPSATPAEQWPPYSLPHQQICLGHQLGGCYMTQMK